ncbi:MAG: hypothetical protein ACK4TG_06960 [Thermaurantiacus sp.]
MRLPQSPMPLVPAAFLPLPVPARDPGARLLLMAVRLWAVHRRAGRSARAPLERLLGFGAPPLLTLLEAWAALMPSWPAAYPCCAQEVSHDEALLLDLVHAAALGDSLRAEELLADLLPEPHRARLFELAGRAAPLLPSG